MTAKYYSPIILCYYANLTVSYCNCIYILGMHRCINTPAKMYRQCNEVKTHERQQHCRATANRTYSYPQVAPVDVA